MPIRNINEDKNRSPGKKKPEFPATRLKAKIGTAELSEDELKDVSGGSSGGDRPS